MVHDIQWLTFDLNQKTGLPITYLSAVDYSIGRALQQPFYCQKIWDVEHLKEVMVSCLEQISEDLTDWAVEQFWK